MLLHRSGQSQNPVVLHRAEEEGDLIPIFQAIFPQVEKKGSDLLKKVALLTLTQLQYGRGSGESPVPWFDDFVEAKVFFRRPSNSPPQSRNYKNL